RSPWTLRSTSSLWNAASNAPKLWPTRKRSLLCSPTSNELQGRRFACRNELATGSVALQRMIVKKAYARAGVDVDLANKLKRGISAFVRQTHGPQVLGKIGGFGGFFCWCFYRMARRVL